MRFFLSLLLLPLFVCSCKKKPSRQKLLTTYISIVSQIGKANWKSDSLIKKIDAAIDNSRNLSKPFDSTIVDTLKIEYLEVQKNISLRLENINLIAEVDTVINLKQKSISHLKDLKKMLGEMFPLMFEVLPTRFANLTNDQQLRMKAFGRLSKEFQQRSLAFEEEMLSFNRKYRFTPEELKQYGL